MWNKGVNVNMSVNIKVGQNSGVINTGNDAVIHNSSKGPPEIDWEKLVSEIGLLKISSDASIKKFADEADEAIAKKDTGQIKLWLSKWIPCVGGLIQTSYYILEISKIFGINK
jgi:hypothetical protein